MNYRSKKLAENDCKLYLITPPKIDLEKFSIELNKVLDIGIVGCFQLRLKNASKELIEKSSETLMPICHNNGVPFILNDRADWAKEIGADGVHVGKGDLSVIDARKLMGKDKVIGSSCYNSYHLAMESGEQGADYVAFGSFFPTKTKDNTERANIDLAENWLMSAIVPLVAIGGITPKNCKPLIMSGVDFLAVISSVWNNERSPASAVIDFKNVIEDTLGINR